MALGHLELDPHIPHILSPWGRINKHGFIAQVGSGQIPNTCSDNLNRPKSKVLKTSNPDPGLRCRGLGFRVKG